MGASLSAPLPVALTMPAIAQDLSGHFAQASQ
ncbi:hypothetical protein X011_00805 [Mycobacterium tuberculosis variant microti OV254]|nr:hypothetical protein X011_00805 [Mycobacterium tuberculosis variant microti OV254]